MVKENTNSKDDFLKPTTRFDFDTKNKTLAKATKKQVDYKETLTKKLAKQGKKTKKSKKTIITTIILSIIFVLLAGCTGLFIWGNDIVIKITGGNSNLFDALTSFFTETYIPLQEDVNGRTNILVFGTSGYDMDGTGNSGNTPHDGAQLTDSIMVISLEQKTGDLALLNLPRDLKVRTGCSGTRKVNEIYHCNNLDGDNERAGAIALMDEVGNILDINFQYYAHINWQSLIQIVDSLGGITVTLSEDINDAYQTGAVFKANTPYTINGEQALGLARARYGTIGGDFSRGNSQQAILVAIKDRIYEKNLSLIDSMSLANSLGDNLRTNLTADDIKTGLHLTSEFDFNKIRQIKLVDYENNIYYLKTANIDGISYVIPSAGEGKYSQIQKHIAEQLKTPEEPKIEAELKPGQETE